MLAAFRPLLIACLCLLLSACLGGTRPVVNYTPTGPTRDGVPAPARLVVFNNSYHCAYEVKIGAAAPVRLAFEEYLIAEVWPGATEASYRRSDANLIIGCDEYTGPWQQSTLRLSAELAAGEPFVHAVLGEVHDRIHPRFRHLVKNDWTQVAALTIVQTTPGQQFRGFAYYGPWPDANRTVAGRVYLPAGVFTGAIRGENLVQGEMRLNDGGVYTGGFRGLSFSGNGTLISANGEVFAGTFSNGRANGEGVCTKPGGAPEYCFRKNGAAAPVPALAQVAGEQLARLEQQEREQLASRAKADIDASETRIANLKRDEQTAPQRVRAEKSAMIKQCECFVAGAPWFKGCLFLTDKDSTWEQREAEKRARERTDAACEAWWKRTGGLSDDDIIKAELERIGKDLNAETAALARKRQQAEAQRAALVKKQDAERAQRLAQQRAAEQARRDEMLRERERDCRERIAKDTATYGFSCGCGAYMPKSDPAATPRSRGTACPA